MDDVLNVLGLVSGTCSLIGGGIFIFLWYRDRKHPNHKKLGYGFLAVGALLLLARFMGWS